MSWARSQLSRLARVAGRYQIRDRQARSEGEDGLTATDHLANSAGATRVQTSGQLSHVNDPEAGPGGLAEALTEAAKLADERTSLFLVIVGVGTILVVLASQLINGLNEFVVDLDPIEFVGALAAGGLILLAGSGVRSSSQETKREAIRGAAARHAAYYRGLLQPRPKSDADMVDRLR